MGTPRGYFGDYTLRRGAAKAAYRGLPSQMEKSLGEILQRVSDPTPLSSLRRSRHPVRPVALAATPESVTVYGGTLPACDVASATRTIGRQAALRGLRFVQASFVGVSTSSAA